MTTSNQLQYWGLQETMRANRAREQETHRSNLADETERNRHNVEAESTDRRKASAQETSAEASADRVAAQNFKDYTKGVNNLTRAGSDIVGAVDKIKGFSSGSKAAKLLGLI